MAFRSLLFHLFPCLEEKIGHFDGAATNRKGSSSHSRPVEPAPEFTIHCGASDEHGLAIVNGDVVLTKSDPSDDRQVWYKDLSYGAGLKDEAGSPAFALVNKSTGEALKHSFCYSFTVRAIRFDPLVVDKSVLWAESKEELRLDGGGGGGFRRIHMINNMDFVFDAQGAVLRPDGAPLILIRWYGCSAQLWRFSPLPHTQHSAPENERRVRVLCQSGDDGLSLAVRDGTVVLASADHKDERQCWVQSFQNTGNVTDDEGHSAFALVNWATGKALRHDHCVDDELVHLAGHSPDSVDVALLWTLTDDLGKGFHGIRTVSDVNLVLDAANAVPEAGGAHDGTPIIVFPWNSGPNQKWKLLPFY